MLNYTPQKRVKTKDREYLDECHMMEVVGLCQLDVFVVLQGSKYVRGRTNVFVSHLIHRVVCIYDCKVSMVDCS